MMKQPYVHLHNHTEYSLLDSLARIDSLVEQAQHFGMNSLAITDHGAMYGVIPFYQACKQAGIHPVLGCEFYLTNLSTYPRHGRHNREPIYHLLLLAENEEGYRNLVRLTTLASRESRQEKPCIDRRWLHHHHHGLIALSSGMQGEIPQALSRGDITGAKQIAGEYRELFGENHFFFELQDHGLTIEKKINHYLIQWSHELGIPLVATNDVHYIHQEDAHIHDRLLCIQSGKKQSDPERFRMGSDQYYFKSAVEMHKQFQHVPEALQNTVQIAKRCQVELPFHQVHFPKYPHPEQETSREYLHKRCWDGAKKRYKTITPEITERLQYELSVIHTMGYDDYFLIVWDFVRFARQQGIAVGPGRGSAAGSLVAYVLAITDIDPIRHQLLFERFLNPERVRLPDIDIDFNYERRDEVIQYVQNRYGVDQVAQIITFGTMAPRAAIRDLGRVLDIPYATIDRLAKLIQTHSGYNWRQDRSIAKMAQGHPMLKILFETMDRIEGLPRHVSTHAAGVVIGDQTLTDLVPFQQGSGQIQITQYAMEYLEQLGLLKMDFLGLRYLTVIEQAVQWVKQIERKKISFQEMNYEDEATYRLLQSGSTQGVFQLESAGMQKVLRSLRPTTFEDVVAVLALYRPGPLEQIPRFIRAKHDQAAITYPHPDLESILERTYGIIVYQEQIMMIAAKMAGFSLGKADILRRAVSKKDKTILREQREAFVTGCKQKGYTESTAIEVYNLILRFADYGFNRSHSVAYAVLAYQTAYLKANHPTAYWTALLNTLIGNQTKIAEYVEEAKRMGIQILPPDVQHSQDYFIVEGSAIRWGLSAIKQVGRQAIQRLLEARKEGPFQDLFDLCQRAHHRIFHRSMWEALIRSGALDSLPGHRALQLAMLDEVMEKASLLSRSQLHLFEEQEEAALRYDAILPFTKQEQLADEREWMGTYVSGHPLEEWRAYYPHYKQIDALWKTEKKGRFPLLALIETVRVTQTKKGEAMAFLTISDESGECEAIVFPALYGQKRNLLQSGEGIDLNATWDSSGSKKLIIEEIRPVERKERILYLKIDSHRGQKVFLHKLQNLLQSNPGETPVYLVYEHEDRILALPVDKYGISPTEDFIQKLMALLGSHAVVYK